MSYRAKMRLFYQTWDVREIQQLDGYDFEMLVALLFLRMGFTVQLTPPRGDQGADLVVTDARAARTAVQVKNTKYALGNEAVQEVLGGMSYYGCSQGIVVTTSEFTSSAQKLATSHSGLSLWDAHKLGDLWMEHMVS
jgi:HJR/Mrr/RecB family endonuclease